MQAIRDGVWCAERVKGVRADVIVDVEEVRSKGEWKVGRHRALHDAERDQEPPSCPA